MLRAFGVSDKGRVRPTNQDCFAIREDLGLLVVADGMGGHQAGEVAARLAVDAVVEYFVELPRADAASAHAFGIDESLSPRANLLRTAILLANAQVLERAVTTDDYAGMGTTIVAAYTAGGTLTVGHVGDSRLYLVRGGALRQLTADDSWMATMLARDPAADPAALQHHPMRHALTNVVGARARTKVHVVEEPIADADLLLLSTDGLHGVLDERWLTAQMTAETEPKAIAEHLVAGALQRGSRDNATAVVARYAGR